MKIAVSGKGGVGKTLLVSMLSKIFVESGYSVIAIDADPDANLAATLGFPQAEEIIPVSEMSDLMRRGQERPPVRLKSILSSIPRWVTYLRSTGASMRALN